MSYINRVTLVGNLGKDAELRIGRSGIGILTFSIATSSSYKDKSTGEWKSNSTWHNIIMFGTRESNARIEALAPHLVKGMKVFVEGSIMTDSYEDKKTGEKRYSTKINAQLLEVLSSGKDRRSSGGGERRKQEPADAGFDTSLDVMADDVPGDSSDDIPF